MHCNGLEGVPEGEQETLHQLQVLKNQTSCIKIFPSSLGLPINPLLVTPTCTRRSSSVHEGDGGVFRSHVSTVLTKSVVRSFTIE